MPMRMSLHLLAVAELALFFVLTGLMHASFCAPHGCPPLKRQYGLPEPYAEVNVSCRQIPDTGICITVTWEMLIVVLWTVH
jgi:hypothetical protein